MSFHIILFQPEIPQNTGSIGRLCVSTDTKLHLIHPLGFEVSDYYLRRSGLDYWQHLQPIHYSSWELFLQQQNIARLLFFTTRGNKSYTNIDWQDGDGLVFGRETSGFPDVILNQYKDSLIKIPMPGDFHRSLNLAQAAAIGLYEALRQVHHW